MMASRAPAEVLADECRVEFAAAFEAFDPRPKIVVDYDQRVLWSCDDAPRLLDAPMPLCVRKGKLVVDDDELKREFVEFLHNVGPEVQRKLIRGKAKRHWAVLGAWKPTHWDRAVCVLASPSRPLQDIVACGLARELKLTTAEVRVLKEFAELNSPKQPQLSTAGAAPDETQAAVSSTADSRPQGVTHIGGHDRCDPQLAREELERCRRILELRAQEFNAPEAPQLSAKQRLLAEQRADDEQAGRSAATRLRLASRDEPDADLKSNQELAALYLAKQQAPPASAARPKTRKRPWAMRHWRTSFRACKCRPAARRRRPDLGPALFFAVPNA